MKLKTELEKLKKHIGKPGQDFDKQLEVIKANFSTEKDKAEIDKFISKEMKELTAHADNLIKDITIREQLREVSQIVSSRM